MKMKTSKKIVCAFLCLLMAFQVSVRAEEFDPTENIALNKEAYASSGSPQLAVDGDMGTRWESAQTDDEWWYVDLGKIYDLSSIEIRWEGAYAKTFELLAANEMPASGQQDAEWKTIVSVVEEILVGFPNEKQYNVDGEIGRYIKFRGIQRGTDYGYSFYEFRVYANGLYVDADDRILETLQIIPNPVSVCQEEEIGISIKAFCNYGGAFKEVDFSFGISDNEGIEVIERDDNYFVKGLKEGVYELTITATSTDGNNTVIEEKVEVIVLEKRKVENITLTSPVEAVVLGRAVALSLVIEDQYGSIIQPEEPIEWHIEGGGEIIDNSYIPIEMGEIFISVSVGEVMSETIQMNCVGYNYNIALNKNVEAIGEVENHSATLVNDGNEGTRWIYNPGNEDIREYEAWITIDLGDIYDIDLVEIYWEGASAADYEVLYSLDNEDFGEAIYSMSGLESVGHVLHQLYGNPGEARFVKILSSKATTQYGISIWEIRVFGTKELVGEGEGNHIVLSGTWNEEAFNAIDNVDITSYDMSQVMGLTVKPTTENPNCLIFVGEGSDISGAENVITGERAEKIVLQDGYAYNNSVKEFNSDEVRYTRDFTGMDGWASLYLPFPVNVEDYQVEYFSSYNAGEASIYFAEATIIEANTPYIIKVDEYTGIITFAATGALSIPLSSDTNFTTPEGSEFTFKGTLEAILGEGTLMLKADGSEFVMGGSGSDIPAFRAYIEANNGSSIKSLNVVHDGEGTTGVADAVGQDDLRVIGGNGSMEIISATSQTVYVYSIDGKLVGKVKLDAGYNKVAVAQGAYIVNNQKVIVK